MRPIMARRLLPACLLVVYASCVGATTGVDYPQDLGSPNPVRRTRAAREFAIRRDKERALQAFCLLRDSEGQVRLLIYGALKEMSPGGEDFGYRPYLEADVRTGTAARWEAWWRQQDAASGKRPAGLAGQEAPGG